MSNTDLEKREARQPAEVERSRAVQSFVPDVDIAETKDGFVLVADVPGVDEKSVEIELERNVLTLRARTSIEAPQGYTLTHREYRTGNYERVFTLGDEIDQEGVKASVKNGVLRLSLPKAKAHKPRRIQVKTG